MGSLEPGAVLVVFVCNCSPLRAIVTTSTIIVQERLYKAAKEGTKFLPLSTRELAKHIPPLSKP
jgi:hypothetical protein